MSTTTPDRREYMRAWKEANREAVREESYQRKYGITLEEYDRLLETQQGVCALCQKEDPRRRLEVDHCHDTGRVRGLLCGTCNRALGLFKDNTDALRRALDYVSGRQ